MAKTPGGSPGERIGLEMLHPARLGAENDTIEQTKLGVIGFNRVSMAPFKTIIAETKVVSLPFILRSTEHMYRVMDSPLG